MSEHEITRIAVLETNQTNIMEKLEALAKRFDSFEEKLDRALDKKANVWVERVFTWFLGAVGLGLIGFVGNLIYKLIYLK